MLDKETFVADVRRFTELAGCTTDQFNVRQTALYLGLQLEEMAEKLQAMAIVGTSLTTPYLNQMAGDLHDLSAEFKRGTYDYEMERVDRESILDADVDLAWVTIGSMLSQGADVLGAMKEVARANLDKFPNGAVTKDANGKVVKPNGWRGPDLSPFVNGNGK